MSVISSEKARRKNATLVSQPPTWRFSKSSNVFATRSIQYINVEVGVHCSHVFPSKVKNCSIFRIYTHVGNLGEKHTWENSAQTMINTAQTHNSLSNKVQLHRGSHTVGRDKSQFRDFQSMDEIQRRKRAQSLIVLQNNLLVNHRPDPNPIRPSIAKIAKKTLDPKKPRFLNANSMHASKSIV